MRRPTAALMLGLVVAACHTGAGTRPVPEQGPSAGAVRAIASAATLAAAPASDSLAALVDVLVARRPDYRALIHALARYRALAADTTIPEFPAVAMLPVRPGDSLPTIELLRARLAALGDLDSSAAVSPGDSSTRYAGAIVEGVRRFQRRHGLADDGIIGPETVAQLQTPLAARAAQIESALARIRREPAVPRGPYVVVNVPAFRLLAFDGADDDTGPALDMKVIVGKAGTNETPSMHEELRYLDFWPYWDVPRSILMKEILPVLSRDSAYLQRQDMELVAVPGDSAVGDTVSPDVLDALRAGALRLRQRRGPTNALGRVKFVIPNDSNIYLHDTPDKSLFGRERRDLSHGCIRVENARALAIWALRGRAAWTSDSVDTALAGPEFRRVALPRPIPVIIEYVTVMANHAGTVWFAPDIYRREGETLNGW